MQVPGFLERRLRVEGRIYFHSIVGVGAVENAFELNRGLKEECMWGEVVVMVRIKFSVADEVTAVLVLELDDIVGMMQVVVIMLVPILVLVLVEMDVVVGRSHG